MILVTGSVLARQDTLEELINLSLEHVQRSRAEPGCHSHTVHRNVEEPLRLVFMEEWESHEALAIHFEVPGSRQFVADATRLGAEPPTLEIYEATSVKI